MLMTHSTDQSSRRPQHREKCTRTANCFIDRHPGTGSTFTRDPASYRIIQRCLAEGHLGSRRPLRVLNLQWCSICAPFPSIDASICSGATHEETVLKRNGTRSSLATGIQVQSQQ
ncbi:uncharacterized protein TNCV_2190901 [Trichonephila clavipes]|uniref:Uncharacterized protein n=1 Tax=Trichonephila clavipes TaxID=2585209 RepID=A0A8X6R806_TRICX|nr:uncharacterized protein TNCV_2190901 [Trichonephila clavipes]